MTAASPDREAYAAADPRVPPQVLADIAARRWDLHPVILGNPQAYPALRQWIATVNPGSVPALAAPAYAPVPTVASAPPPRRSGIGWWLGGCGCLAVGVVAIIVFVVALGALSGSGSPSPSGGDRGVQPTGAGDPEAQAQLAIYESERARYDELAAQLVGNPVAPLVLIDEFYVQGLEREAAETPMSESRARSVAERMQGFRAELEVNVTAAESRRTIASGSITEPLVDQAGDGFIDVRWDAAEFCDSDGGTLACVDTSDPLTIHLMPETSLGGDWSKRMVVTHELAHVYQEADAARFDDGGSSWQRLLDRGLFQGSDEKMADCYALTVHDAWSLSSGNFTVGYGYVCDAAERQAIREWAAELNAPMPG
jgi:hypothetical protein